MERMAQKNDMFYLSNIFNPKGDLQAKNQMIENIACIWNL